MKRAAIALVTVVSIMVAAQSGRADGVSEEQFAASVVVPRCEAGWGLDSAKAEIALEKANPSGVVDLAALHAAGVAVQYWQAQIKKLDVAYVARRHRAFAGWMTEPACIVDFDKSMAERGCTRVEDAGGRSHHWVCP